MARAHFMGSFMVWAALAALVGCGKSKPLADNGSSETHFLRACSDECEGGLSCLCGVCSVPCSDDAVCAELADGASCVEHSASACEGGGAPVQACELDCRRDDDCAELGGDFRCADGACRAAQPAPAPDAGGAVDAGTSVCGEALCDADERCCDPCSSACVPRLARIDCVADNGPVECDAGATPQCAAAGESCLQSACCSDLLCCRGVPIPPDQALCFGGACPMSDRNVKRDIVSVDADAVLEGVAALPIARWRYRDDPAGAPHLGPMAQDFHAAFAVGVDDRRIASVDGDGVALAAIQALYRRVIELERQQQSLQTNNRELNAELARLRRSAARSTQPAAAR